tara:strand:- start:151 stop:549 length:399 start_codon:yes stop_codon:yes gene_type:complete
MSVQVSYKNLADEAEKFMKEKGNDFTFDAYQREAKETAIYPHNMKILYPALGLTGEAGEVANKVKKLIRDGVDNMPPDWREQIAGEIGDVLWYCAAIATDLNISLGQVAMSNKNKLSSRKERGKIGGFGDTR